MLGTGRWGLRPAPLRAEWARPAAAPKLMLDALAGAGGPGERAGELARGLAAFPLRGYEFGEPSP